MSTLKLLAAMSAQKCTSVLYHSVVIARW